MNKQELEDIYYVIDMYINDKTFLSSYMNKIYKKELKRIEQSLDYEPTKEFSKDIIFYLVSCMLADATRVAAKK
jgi:hypothetical protein